MSIYEFTGHSMIVDGHTVHQIRATRDLLDRGVAAGEIGGWIESADNLVEYGWVGEDAVAYDGSIVSGSAMVRGHARVKGRSRIKDNSIVYEQAVVDGATLQDRSLAGGTAHLGPGCVLTVDTHLREGAWPSAEGITIYP